MEKLLKLLNEYQKGLNDKEGNKRNYEIYERELRGGNIRMKDLDDPYEGFNMYGGYAKARIISKQSGFIKRLVDSDKIDERKLDEYRGNDYDHFNRIETLIQILSIQDDPIDLLCKLLK